MSLSMFKHVLPTAKAWCITQAKKLREFFEGLVHLQTDYKEFTDLTWLDIFPETTRELDAWEEQFFLIKNTGLSTQDRRDRLDARWKTIGGQDPRYIQDTLQANGFDIYIHEWWVPASDPAVARDPSSYITGNSYMLVNIIYEANFSSINSCGNPNMVCGRSSAVCGASTATSYTRKVYAVPTDPNEWPYVLYFGGATFPNGANITPSRRDEFERLVLSLCPAQQWLGMIISYLVLIGKVTSPDAVGPSMNMYAHFYEGGWETPILAATNLGVHVECVIKDTSKNVYFVYVFGNTANKNIRVVKVNRDGTITTSSVLQASSVTPQFSILRLNHNQSKLYLYRSLSISANQFYEMNPGTLVETQLIASSSSTYKMSDFKVSSDNLYVWYNAGSLGTDVRRMLISDQTTILFTGSYQAASIHLTMSDVAWRASVSTDGKISKYTETGGIITETIYSNTDMQYIRHIIMDLNGDLICLQRDGSGNSKLFKVCAADGQTLYTYDFTTSLYIYNISVDEENNYYVDQEDGATKNVFLLAANPGPFSTPVSIGNQSNPYDHSDYTSSLI